MESRRRFLHPYMERRSDGEGRCDPLTGLRAKRSRWYPGKSGYGNQSVTGKRKREASSEAHRVSFQEKLLVEMHIRPVPKPTQVGAQRMRR